jgi:hypothetical protein
MKRAVGVWVVLACASLIAGLAVADGPGEGAGSIRVVVSDAEFGGPVPEVSVALAERNVKVKTGDDGHILFEGVPAGTYSLVFAKAGYERRVESAIVVIPGRMAEVTVELKGEFSEMEELVVRDMELVSGGETGVLQLRQESPAVMDSIGKDVLGKAGQSTVAGALKLVSGASVEDGKYAVIRGLGDRYTSTQINGVRLPSADPEKRAVQLDQFPTALIDSLQVTKTFMPDQQGDSGAGAINLVTRSIPKEPVVSAKFSRGNRRNVTGNENFRWNDRRVGYWGEEPDRALPVRSFDIPGINRRASLNDSVDADEARLDQLTHSLSRIVGTTTRPPPPDQSWSVTAADIFDPKWGWQLGWLYSFSHSRKYDGYNDALKQVVRANSSESALTEVKDAFHEDKGVESILWGRMVGVGLRAGADDEFAFTWMKNHASDNISVEQRHDIPVNGMFGASDVGYKEILDYTERNLETRQWSGRHRFASLGDKPFFGGMTLKAPVLDWTSSHNTSTLDEPDRIESGARAKIGETTEWSEPFLVRNWYEIEEVDDQLSFNFKVPFKTLSGSEGFLKAGTFLDQDRRSYQSDYVSYSTPPSNLRIRVNGTNYYYSGYVDKFYPVSGLHYSPQPGSTGPDPLWNVLYANNLGLLGGANPSDVLGTIVQRGEFSQQDPIDYKGDQKIKASYAMYDLPVASWLRLSGGARWEYTLLQTEVDAHSINDTLIVYEPTTTDEGAKVISETRISDIDAGTTLERIDTLPAFGVVIEPKEKLYFRWNWSKTIARPTFKELTPILSPVYGSNDRFVGNRTLEISDMVNRDFRAEWFYRKDCLVAFSAFEKKISNVIDRDLWNKSSEVFVIPVNYDMAELTGTEFEWRQALGPLWNRLDGVSISANYTKLHSVIPYDEGFAAQISPYSGDTTRPMQAQPDEIFNFNVTYENTIGSTFGLFYNFTGEQLVAGQSFSESGGGSIYTPSLYIDSTSNIGWTFSQKFFKRWTLSFAAKRPLKATTRQYYQQKEEQWTRSEVPTTSDYSIGLGATF